MAQHPEYELINSIVSRGEMDVALEMGVTTDSFQIITPRQAWKYLLRWYKDPSTWGLTVSPGHFIEEHPKFPYEAGTEPTRALCQRLIDKEVHVQLVALSAEIIDRIEGREENPQGVLQVISDKIYQLSANHGKTEILKLGECGDRVMEKIQMAEDGLIPGIPWAWQTMNYETGGKHPGDWIVFYGLQKSMKTWMLIADAESSYTDYHQRVLFYTREMPPEQIMLRVASRMARVDYTKALRGRLPAEDKCRVARAMAFMKTEETYFLEEGSKKFFMITSDRGTAKGGGVTSLMTLIRKFQPTVVYADGVYLMRNDRSGKKSTDWSDIQQISQDIKDGAMTAKIPIIGTMQENKKGSIAYSSGVAQDVDLTLNVTKRPHPEGPDKGVLLYVTFPESRETRVSGMVLHGYPATNFDFLYPITEDMKAQIDEEDNKKPARTPDKGPARTPVPPPTSSAYKPNIVR
jgi:hypothetical protein